MSADDVRNAYCDGQQARHNKKPESACPHVGNLESAWREGWKDADDTIAEANRTGEAIRITVGEITDYLSRKAERFEAMGDAKSALLFETLVDYINGEWGSGV